MNWKPSPYWPGIKATAKVVKGLSGTPPLVGLAIDAVTQFQDDFGKGKGENRDEIRSLLETIVLRTGEIARSLKGDEGFEEVDEETLGNTALGISEALYLGQLATGYLYADFKGIEQLERTVPVKLDEVFVDLMVAPEPSDAARVKRGDELRRRLVESRGLEERESLESGLTELDLTKSTAEGGSQPRTIDHELGKLGRIVLLAGPGSGKTTLVKRLARSFALGPEVARERHPELPWLFPVVVPIATFDAEGGPDDLLDFLRRRLRDAVGEALVRAFRRRWAEGQCLVLLDGLDEVADTTRRIAAARQVDDFVQGAGDNQVLVTSRPVGYSICRLAVPIEHRVLLPFSPEDVARFVRAWHLSYDRAARPEAPDPRRAEAESDALLDDIRSNERVQSLASNPLMLTIIALIKHQNVTLPERRVQLYDLALNTLIRSWNKARSLARRPIGEELGAEESKKVWAAVADWMHREKSTGTCSAQQLQDRLVEILREINPNLDALKAEQTAESYVTSAAERSGLLEARGARTFAFMHQTFQEYLAARHMAVPHSRAIARALAVSRDPRWHEVIRLVAGFIGVVQEDDDMASDFVQAIATDATDPLDAFLCDSLRLAASCIADDSRIRQPVVDRVIVDICDRLRLPYSSLRSSLTTSLSSMRSVIPGPAAVKALDGLTDHGSWPVRTEIARLLGRAASRDRSILDRLRSLLDDEFEDVRALAALGLWRSGERQDPKIAMNLAEGLISQSPGLKSWRDDDFVPDLVKLLDSADPEVVWNAARLLGEWGHRAEAKPALVALLASGDSDHVWGAARLLGVWGHRAEAKPTLAALLASADADNAMGAAQLLGEWGHRAEATPALAALLASGDAEVRWDAARLLADWGHRAEAKPALIDLLTSGGAHIRPLASRWLRDWGFQAEAKSALVALLASGDDRARWNAAQVFGQWGHHAEATPALVALLASGDAEVRWDAARLLGQWGHRAEATPPLIALLVTAEDRLRFQAARLLGDWGLQAEATPALAALLASGDANVRWAAARLLGLWGHRTEATPALAGLLTSGGDDIRFRVPQLLSDWGPQPGVETALVALLVSGDAKSRWAAATVLGNWGSDADVIRAVISPLGVRPSNASGWLSSAFLSREFSD